MMTATMHQEATSGYQVGSKHKHSQIKKRKFIIIKNVPCKKRWHFPTHSNSDNNLVGKPIKTFNHAMLVYAIKKIQ